MNTGVFVLLMIWGGYSARSGIAIVQQEFNSLQSCEAARTVLAQAHDKSYALELQAQGCFAK